MTRAVRPSLPLAAPVGRRRRPSGEPPPLPRHIDATTRFYVGAVVATVVLGTVLRFRPVLVAVTRVDLAVLRAIERLRVDPLTRAAVDIQDLGSALAVQLAALVTIAVLIAVRRFRHLAVYVGLLLFGLVVASTAVQWVGRMRPVGVTILGSWNGYAHPSLPLVGVGLVLAGAVYTLVPAGRWRDRAKIAAGSMLVILGVARLYVGVDHPSDVLAGLVLGWALPVVVFRLATPDEVFPVTYRGGRRAHLEVGGARGEAIVHALDQQLGLDVVAVEPFGQASSAGSTPVRLRVQQQDGESLLFGKLYAVNHLRADRWYKFTRTVLYGRLEDEKPFSSVRRLVEYEDHLLRLLRDAGLPTPKPYGFVEITPEREYLVVMEFFPGAVELDAAPAGDDVVDAGLEIVRQLWDAGVAHRDIKPSNLLVRDGRVFLIDVAFGTVRPTPWRQAVDLANMMLTLALASTPERVYERALQVFDANDIAEAFAASRGVTIPSQLRTRLRADGRDLLTCFRRLAPQRPVVPIQVWTVRRVAVTAGVLLAAGVTTAVAVAALNRAWVPNDAAPACDDSERVAIVAQSVPSAAYLPCVGARPIGWSVRRFTVADGHTRVSLVSDRARSSPVRVELRQTCDVSRATPGPPRAAGVRTYRELVSISPRYAGTMFDVFPGGCVSYQYDFERGVHISLLEEMAESVQLVARRDVRADLRHQLGVDLDR